MFFYFPYVGKHYLKRKSGRVLRGDAPKRHIVKPDRDNLVKSCLDALTTLGMWRDDCQVCDGETRKIYVEENPGAWIRIRRLGN